MQTRRLLLATLLIGLAQQPIIAASAAVEQFQGIALRVTRHSGADGPRAVENYHRAAEGASLESLYSELAGPQIARARLTAAGWQMRIPNAPLTFTVNRPSDDLLLVITNATPHEQRVEVAGADRDLRVTGISRLVAGNTTTGVFVPASALRLGRFRSALRIAAGSQAASVPIWCDGRAAGRLAVRIFDAAGHPTPARIFLTSPDGFNRTPEGAFERVMWMSGEHYFYASGSFQMDLPAGDGAVEAVKGFEYRPARVAWSIRPGATTRVDVFLNRLENMRSLGWYSGDDHIHGNYRGRQWTTPADDVLVARAEDLQVASMMVANSDGAFLHDESYFHGADPYPLSTPSHGLYWNEELRNRSMYGHLLFFGLKELVRPVYTGFPDTPQADDWPANYEQAANAKGQGAFTAYAHPAVKLDAFPSGSDAREAVVDVPLGAIDALEVFCSQEEASMRLWYRFLNCGFPLGISGGSDAFLNQSFAFVAGGDRVYVHAGVPFTEAGWRDGLKRGAAFATVGPLLFFTVDGRPPGEHLNMNSAPVRLHVSAQTRSIIPVSRLEIVRNGRVLHVERGSVPTDRLSWSGTVTLEGSAWIAARVWGPRNRLICNGPSRWAERSPGDVLLAHTGVTWVNIPGGSVSSTEDRAYLLGWLESLIADLKKSGSFSSTQRRDHVREVFERARAVYLSLR